MMKHSNWQWLIEPEPQGKGYRLKFKKPTEWREANNFDTPEAAADAVAQGKTGQKEWDELTRTSSIPGLAAWLIDPGGPIAAVADVIKAAMAPTQADVAKKG